MKSVVKICVVLFKQRKVLFKRYNQISLYNLRRVTSTTFSQQILVGRFRPVHGLVRVGFVPNPELAQPDQVLKISTRCRLEWLIRLGRSDLQWIAVTSVRVGDLKIGQNLEKSAKFRKIGKISMIFLPDLAKSLQIR